MKKIIRVIKIDGKYLSHFYLNEHCQPLWLTSHDIFLAIDMNKPHMLSEKIWKMYMTHGAVIENYELTAVNQYF